MKVVVKMAILVAAMLLVANMGFAQNCDGVGDIERCYEITSTNEDSSTTTDFYIACLHPDGTGSLWVNNGQDEINLYLFSGGPSGYGTEQGPPLLEWTTWISEAGDGETNGYIWTPVYGVYIRGVYQYEGSRTTFEGIRVPCLANGEM